MLTKEIERTVKEFVATSPNNIVEELEMLSAPPTSSSKMRIWELPLVAVAKANDPFRKDLGNPMLLVLDTCRLWNGCLAPSLLFLIFCHLRIVFVKPTGATG